MADAAKPIPALPIIVAGGFSYGRMVHGLTENALEAFRQRGYDLTVVPFDMQDMQDMEIYEEHVASVFTRTLNARHARQGSLIGFSAGAVAAYGALLRHQLAGSVDTYVGCAGPFRGSQLSRLARPTSVLSPLRHLGIQMDVSTISRQLSNGSSYLSVMAAQPPPPGPWYVTVAGKYDYICPADTALLDGTEQLVLDFSHHDIVHSESLHETVLSFCK